MHDHILSLSASTPMPPSPPPSTHNTISFTLTLTHTTQSPNCAHRRHPHAPPARQALQRPAGTCHPYPPAHARTSTQPHVRAHTHTCTHTHTRKCKHPKHGHSRRHNLNNPHTVVQVDATDTLKHTVMPTHTCRSTPLLLPLLPHVQIDATHTPRLLGRPFSSLQGLFPNAIPLGLSKAGGIVLNPPPDTRVEEGVVPFSRGHFHGLLTTYQLRWPAASKH